MSERLRQSIGKGVSFIIFELVAAILITSVVEMARDWSIPSGTFAIIAITLLTTALVTIREIFKSILDRTELRIASDINRVEDRLRAWKGFQPLQRATLRYAKQHLDAYPIFTSVMFLAPENWFNGEIYMTLLHLQSEAVQSAKKATVSRIIVWDSEDFLSTCGMAVLRYNLFLGIKTVLVARSWLQDRYRFESILKKELDKRSLDKTTMRKWKKWIIKKLHAQIEFWVCRNESEENQSFTGIWGEKPADTEIGKGETPNTMILDRTNEHCVEIYDTIISIFEAVGKELIVDHDKLHDEQEIENAIKGLLESTVTGI